jgi:hypothetical protein
MPIPALPDLALQVATRRVNAMHRCARSTLHRLRHKSTVLLLVAAAVGLSISTATAQSAATKPAIPNVILIITDDKYVCCHSSGEKPLQIRTFFRFPGFQQTMADCDEFTGIAMN